MKIELLWDSLLILTSDHSVGLQTIPIYSFQEKNNIKYAIKYMYK